MSAYSASVISNNSLKKLVENFKEHADIIVNGKGVVFIDAAHLNYVYERYSESGFALDYDYTILPDTEEDYQRYYVSTIVDMLMAARKIQIFPNIYMESEANLNIISKTVKILRFKKISPLMVFGLHEFQNNLQKLVWNESRIKDIKTVLQFYGDLSNEPEKWMNLQYLDLSNNKINYLLDTMSLLPVVVNLNLSFNKIKDLHVLDAANIKLEKLNVSHNHLKTFTLLSVLIHQNLTYLNLQYNHLTTLEGIQKLVNLEYLNVSYNKLKQDNVFVPIYSLYCLKKLKIYGNPISFSPWWKLYITRYIHPKVCESVIINDKLIKEFSNSYFNSIVVRLKQRFTNFPQPSPAVPIHVLENIEMNETSSLNMTGISNSDNQISLSNRSNKHNAITKQRRSPKSPLMKQNVEKLLNQCCSVFTETCNETLFRGIDFNQAKMLYKFFHCIRILRAQYSLNWIYYLSTITTRLNDLIQSNESKKTIDPSIESGLLDDTFDDAQDVHFNNHVLIKCHLENVFNGFNVINVDDDQNMVLLLNKYYIVLLKGSEYDIKPEQFNLKHLRTVSYSIESNICFLAFYKPFEKQNPLTFTIKITNPMISRKFMIICNECIETNLKHHLNMKILQDSSSNVQTLDNIRYD
ncbi:hypothetical protein A3Q56_01459 [Intoshia linei]|uniref:Uncharacterized protein n=1 Tax=Intoshia linei TaxID=1819745 RepID=A0A177B938_9BILA|nr:hypothetical protein A3Q56_01459 [Intoshia linei]